MKIFYSVLILLIIVTCMIASNVGSDQRAVFCWKNGYEVGRGDLRNKEDTVSPTEMATLIELFASRRCGGDHSE